MHNILIPSLTGSHWGKQHHPRSFQGGYIKVAFSCEHRLLFSVKTTITIHINIIDTVYNSNYILGSYCFHRTRESAFTRKRRQKLSEIQSRPQTLSVGQTLADFFRPRIDAPIDECEYKINIINIYFTLV